MRAESSSPTPRRDDATYAVFFAAGLAIALLAGLLLGAFAPLLPAGAAPAHALLQSLGWIGLVVAGMGLRLAARLAHRPRIPIPLVLAVLVLLLAGLLAWAAGLEAGRWVWAAGAVLNALCLFRLLLPPPAAIGGWWPGMLAGAAWWLAAAAFAVTGRTLETELAVILGVGAGFAFAVASRMIPVFFGRRPVGIWVMLAGLVPFHAGLVAVLAGVGWAAPLSAFGMALLLALSGASGAPPSGLTAAAAGAAPALRLANGLGLLGAAAIGLAVVSPAFLDAAVHLTGLGFLSVLIVGMAELLLPPFGLERTRPARFRPERWSAWLLGAGAVMRALWLVLALPAWWLAAAGSLSWLGLAGFAFGLARAGLRGPGLRAALTAGAQRKGGLEDEDRDRDAGQQPS